jgi:hypothetical protein
MSQININTTPNHQPRQFTNGTWSCCARAHERPESLNETQRFAYESLYPHVTEWDDTLPDGTTEILFGIAETPLPALSR